MSTSHINISCFIACVLYIHVVAYPMPAFSTETISSTSDVISQRHHLESTVRSLLREVEKEYEMRISALNKKKKYMHKRPQPSLQYMKKKGNSSKPRISYQEALDELKKARDKRKRKINEIKRLAIQELNEKGRISSRTWEKLSQQSRDRRSFVNHQKRRNTSTIKKPKITIESNSPETKNKDSNTHAFRQLQTPITRKHGHTNPSNTPPAKEQKRNNSVIKGTITDNHGHEGKGTSFGDTKRGGGFSISRNGQIGHVTQKTKSLPDNVSANSIRIADGKPIRPTGGFSSNQSTPNSIYQTTTGLWEDTGTRAAKKQTTTKRTTANVREMPTTAAHHNRREPKHYVSSTIICPPYKVKVVNNIPSSWTPSFASLTFSSASATEVKVSDGRETMFCYYGDNTSPFFVHRATPPGQICSTYERNSFRCRKKGPYMFSEGTITLKPSQRAFLFGRNNSHLFWWRADSKDVQYLEVNPAHKVRKINHEPSPRECEELLRGRTPERYSGDNVRQGDNFCFAYNSRYGKFRVTSVSRKKPKTISIHFVIWTSARDY